jgi:hypothetical protein
MISSIYKRLIQIGKVSGAVAFLFAAPYALWQYIEVQRAARVEQTITLYKLYNAAPFTTYREHVTKALARNKDQIAKASVSEKDLEKEQFEIISKEDIEVDLLMIFDFFDGVAVCVTSGLCDDPTAVQLFKQRAADIYLNFYQYMTAMRGNTARVQFGWGLQAIAKSGHPTSTPRLIPLGVVYYDPVGIIVPVSRK